MTVGPGTPSPDLVALAHTMAALANPTRLALLDQLRVPSPLGDVRVAPTRATVSKSDSPVSSRQTVRHHVTKLEEEGFLVALDAERSQPATRYVVDTQRLFRFTEEVRALSAVFAGRLPEGLATGSLHGDGGGPPQRGRGTQLVLAHGVYEGKVFPLDVKAGKPARIGRQKGLEVSLDYDPFVSRHQASIERDGDHLLLHDGGGKNRTTLNWHPLTSGGYAELRSGDVIGVGRSLLCLQG